MPERKKKIVLLSYHFPPSRAIGGRRIAAFARYLREFDWEPAVVTIRESEIGEKDPESLATLGGIPIRRVGRLPSLRNIYLGAKARLKAKPEAAASGNASGENSGQSGPPGTKQRIKHFLAALAFLPDEYRTWALPAAVATLSVMRRERADYLLTSCPPYSSHLAGLLVKLVRGRRLFWIADFRDPWMVPNEKEIYPTTSFSRAIEYGLEGAVIRRCDLVLTTTQRLADRLADHYGDQPREKFRVVPNGYEPDALPSDGGEKYPCFTISYTGALYFGRTPEPLFEAVRDLLAEGVFTSDSLCIQLVGFCQAIDGVATGEVAARYGLEEVVRVVDSVPQAEAAAIISRSHVALLLAPGQPFQIPGKTYEYIGLGTPIMALTEDGATADLLNSVTGSRALHPGDIAGIKSYLADAAGSDREGATGIVSETERFTRRSTVATLSGFLDELS